MTYENIFGYFQDFLKRFSRYNFDGFCLGVLFTNRAFSELVLGLSWRGNPDVDGVGGVCQNRVRIKSDGNAYSFNALFIRQDSSMTTINSVNRLRRSADPARCAELAERLSLLTEFIVVIDELRTD